MKAICVSVRGQFSGARVPGLAARFSSCLPGIPFWLVVCLAGIVGSPACAQLVISEFMAVNNRTLSDEDGENSDWIEIHNPGTVAINLDGWFLTDATNNLAKWRFPATNLPANGYLVVFASEKDRRTPGAPLHTNFKLSSSGEYLALVRPDGTTVASQFAPGFPLQVADVSYGLSRNSSNVIVLNTNAPARAFVPRDASLGLSWTEPDFDDRGWTSGTTGIGYDTAPDYLPFIGLNVQSQMLGSNQSAYARIPFDVGNPAAYDSLKLRVKYDDGFIAWLNGFEIARDNAPDPPQFDSGAPANRADTDALVDREFDVTEFIGFLIAGQNVLSFQILNNGVNSSDLLLVPVLEAGTASVGPSSLRYFPAPTPGAPNDNGVVTLGPIITEASHTPNEPQDDEDIYVTARLRLAFAPVASATLRYRVMFSNEVSTPFLDDGAHGDGAVGDGVYGAIIPAGASGPGQMVRWYVSAVDTTGTNVSRFPAFSEPLQEPEYLGTVVVNPALTNGLPVLHWFVQNVAATDTFTGTRASVFFLGEFYDNVFNRVRGASAPSFPKKPYKFDFHRGYHFRYRPGVPRVEEINLNTTYQNKAYVNAGLTFETYAEAGVPACDAFLVRVQQNNAFFNVSSMTEQVDEDFLQKRGLNPGGALYKVFNGINSANTGVEKKTRRNENNSDLQQLVNALGLTNPARGTNLFDLLDLPEVINYLAAGVVAQEWDRVIKNIYLYRDPEGTQLWQLFPWDKDLSFGKVGLVNDDVTAIKDATTGASGEPYISHPFYGSLERNCCGVNNLFDAVYKTPVTREMFLRRLRSLIETLLQPPGTPVNGLKYERRIDEIFSQLKNDAALDLARWGAGYGALQTAAQAIGILKTNYLVARRLHLFQTHSVTNLGGANTNVVGIPLPQPTDPLIEFGAVDYNPASGNQAEEYVELVNREPAFVDLSGWRVAGGIDFTLKPGTVIPANGKLYLSPNIPAFRARAVGPRGGLALFVHGHYSGELSARGERLRLLDPVGNEVSSLAYPGAPSPAQLYLRVTEIMYHPAPLAGNTNDAEAFEYVELKNLSPASPLDLRGVRLAGGLQFAFSGSAITNLAPGATVLVVRNLAAFTARYGGSLRLAGQYGGGLDNDGERLVLLDAANEEILDFTYDNDWYPITDGHGFSLVVVDEAAEPDLWNDRVNWRPSGALHGSPGAADPPPPTLAPILVNEVLSRTDAPPPTDSIELFNPTTNAVNLGGWFLSDDFNTPKKFRIPDGTVILAGGYRVFTEGDFNTNPASPLSFSFRSTGDEAWLFSAEAGGNLTGYFHGFAFGAAENGVSFGRHVTSIGREHFVAQAGRTLGATNAGPRVGPVVISEIHYRPADESGGADNQAGEFIELFNLSANPVALFDVTQPASTWQLRDGVDFAFPTNVTLASSNFLLVVSFDPADPAAVAAFRSRYAVPPDVPVFGPYGGKLDNSGETVALYKPEPPNGGIVPYVLVEAVEFSDSAPWPSAPDGFGPSLQRLAADRYGNDPIQWTAAAPSAGAALRPGTGPTINTPPVSQTVLAGQNATFRVTASGSALLRFQWTFNGASIPSATNDALVLANAQRADAGGYQVAVFNGAGSVVSTAATLRVSVPAAIAAQPQNVIVRVGQTATFTVAATGSRPFTFQWRRNGVNIPGATGTTLTLVGVQLDQAGPYDVMVSNPWATVVSAAASLTVLAGNYPGAVLADNPVHYWRFNETSVAQPAADQGAPGGNPGAFTGGITVGQPTQPDGLGVAARFGGGAGTFVNVGLFHPGNSITLEAWILLDPDARLNTFNAIMARWDGSYDLSINGAGLVAFTVRNAANAFATATSASAAPRGQWNHVVGLFTNGIVRAFLNGLPGSPSSLVGDLRNAGPNPDRVLIGATRTGTNASTSFNWKGLIDEVAVYSYALSPSQVQSHYLTGIPANFPPLGFLPAVTVSWPAFPAGYRLQGAAALGLNTTWLTSTSNVETRIDRLRFTVPLSNSPQFFRLIRE